MDQKKGNILVADDDEDILFSAELMLEDDFANIYTATSETAIFKQLERNDIDVLLLDMNFAKGATSGKQGLIILEKVLEKYPQISVVMSTSFGDIDLAVNAMQKGAKDFVTKPWNNIKLIEKLNKALHSHHPHESKLGKASEGVREKSAGSKLIYFSEAMSAVHNMAKKVATTESNILILGENGTGKGLLAEEIHHLSHRSKGPFVQIDLGALSESLFEAELFGHAKGAFTDAQVEKKGRIEEADGGTLFLDEIGNLPSILQAKMLSVIQNKRLIRLGETKERTIDFRLITATNMPLQEMIVPKEGSFAAFRSDLFFRINTVTIDLPPLRKRTADILPLAQYFLKLNGQMYQKKELHFTEAASQALVNHQWPGNIRELSHTVEQAVIFSDNGWVDVDDLHLPQRPSAQAIKTSNFQAENLSLEEMEQQAILQLLKKHQGNITKVAKELGIGRTTLYRKMEKYGM